MRYPEFLKTGGRIGFIAPSFGCAIEPYKSDFEESLKWFEEKGYSTVLGPNCFCDEGIGISNTPEKCAAEANNFLMNDRSDVIISCGGGELMCEILPFINFEKIASSTPKWFMGYSDNTNLTFLLNTLCDTASIYSVCASKFTGSHHQCVDDAFNVLCGKKLSVSNYDSWYKDACGDKDTGPEDEDENTSKPSPIGVYVNEKTGDAFDIFPYKQYIYNGDNPIDSAEISGRLIGGCMDCLVGIRGTRFDKVDQFLEKYKDDGFVWFLESCDLNVFSMRRAMWQMYESGWFKYCRGFMIGRPLQFNEPMFDLDQYDAILYTVEKLGVPVIMDADIGHLSPMMPLICGSLADITLKDGKLTVDMKLQ